MHTLYKNTFITAVTCLSLSSLGLLAQGKTLPTDKVKAPVTVDPNKQKQNMSYGLGFQNGEQFASFGFIDQDIDKEAYIKGLTEALMKKEFGRDPIAYDQAMKAFDTIISLRERNLAATNEAAEKAFLEKNGKREEVITTSSGLQYEILTKGTGKKYTLPKSAVKGLDLTTEFHIKSKGTLLNGIVFMETPKDEAIPYDLQVIKGLAEALKIMPVGSKWKLYVPAVLGFGENRQGPNISPKSMLIYEIELTEIKTSPSKLNLPNHPQPLIPR